jgi:aldehyde dehydrogenase (NAD+)
MSDALPKFRNTIASEAVDPAGGAWIESFDPFAGKPWALIPRCGPADVEAAVQAAHAAFSGPWGEMTPTQRGKLLRRFAALMAENAERLAEIEVRDNGKLIAEMSVQCKYAPEWFEYFAGLADKIEGAVLPIDKPEMFNFTRHEPLGVVACIVPWNSPILLLAWKLAPALAAGNTAVIKPSEFASVSILELVKLFAQVGFPPGVVNTVTGFGNDVGEPLAVHPLVRKVAFTGGDVAGRRVYEAAAKGFKGVTLELGGKSPNIVFADANLDNAVKGAISGIFAASGQTCIAGSRLLVQKSIQEDFTNKLVQFAATARMGDPQKRDTQVGPITTKPQYQRVLDYIDIGRGEGAKVLLGGGKPDDPALAAGWFVQPTIFGNVDNRMRIAQEEVFGPILSIIPFADDEEAIALGNDIAYGLAAGVWTSNIARAFKMSERLQAGTVWVNTYRAVSYMSPFGGYKASGLGRESGQDAIYEFLQTKSVWISLSDTVANPFVLR